MQLHQLKPTYKRKSAKRIGRGGKKGTYAGRGIKGQKSRAGFGQRVGFVGGDTPLFKRLPKQRGAVGKVKLRKRMKKTAWPQVAISLKKIEKAFKANEVVSPKTLFQKGLIDRIKNRLPQVKILGQGQAKKKLIFQGVSFSKKNKKS